MVKKEIENESLYQYIESTTSHTSIKSEFPSKDRNSAIFFLLCYNFFCSNDDFSRNDSLKPLYIPILFLRPPLLYISYIHMNAQQCLLYFSLHWSKFIARMVIFHPNDTFAINSSKNPNGFARSREKNIWGERIATALQLQDSSNNRSKNNSQNIFVSHWCRYHLSISCTTTSYFFIAMDPTVRLLSTSAIRT